MVCDKPVLVCEKLVLVSGKWVLVCHTLLPGIVCCGGMGSVSEMEGNQDQQHPQEKRDREIVNRLLQQQPNEYNLAELARLRIRYDSFPGARAIQRDLDLLLQRWQLTEQQLFEKTLQIHQAGLAYRRNNSSGSQDDWT